MRRKAFGIIGCLLFSVCARAAVGPHRIEGPTLSGKTIQVEAETRHWLVAVFVSAKCPCSDSHVKELKALAKDFPEARFIGVHSNADEKEVAAEYFKRIDLPFAVIEDGDGHWAAAFKALKTPHAFIVSEKGELLYRGGVSDSHLFEKSEHHFLREALSDLREGKPVRTAEGRTLGCVISRGESNVW